MRTLALAVLLALGPSNAAAQAPDPRAVIVRVDAELAARLAERLRGQLSDFDIELVVSNTGPVESRLADQIQAAVELAGDRAGAMVVWIARASGTPHVYLFDVAEHRVFARPALSEGSDPEGLVRSVGMEQAAVILRTAVAAVLSGTPVGIDEDEALAEAAPEQPAPEAAPVVETTLPASETTAAGFWRVGLGWRASVDGMSPAGAHAVVLDVSHSMPPVIFGLLVEGGIPLELGDERVVLALSRHAVLLQLGIRLDLLAALALELGIGAGGAAYYRETRSAAAPLAISAPRWTLTPWFLLSARLVGQFTEWLAGWIGAALEGLPSAPQLAIHDAAGAPAVLGTLLPASLRVEVALAVTIFP